MRSMDVVKCWPFDDITRYDERKIKSFLPQITVNKFRWWFDEVQFAIAKSSKKVKRKKGLKRNERIVEEGEESGDDRVASKKVKAPKRRSIVELFAAAPPVHNEEEEFDGDKDEGVPSFRDRKEKKIKKGHPQGKILLKKKFKKDKKQLNMKENGLMEFKITKKKRPFKSVMHPPVLPIVSSSSLFDKQLNEDNIGAGWCEKKKPQLELLAKGKKSKVVRTSKLFSDCLKTESPPQHVVGEVLPDNSSISLVSRKASDKHWCGTRLSNLDDIIEKLRQKSSPLRCSKLREVSLVNSSDVSLPKDCVRENSWVTNVSKSISINTEVNLGFEPIIERNLCETQHPLDIVNIIRNTRNVQENSLNREHCSMLTEEHHLYAFASGPAVSLGDYGQQVNFQLPGSASFAPNRNRFGSVSGNNFPSVNELYLKEYATAPLQSSLSTLNENTAMHPQFMQEASTRNFRSNFITHYPIPHLTPKELMHTICSPLSWKQKERVHGEISMVEDFVGLPLNSQGELIKMNSNRKTVVGQLSTSSTIARNLTSLGASTDALFCRAKFSDAMNMPRSPQELDCQTLKHVNNLHIQKSNSSSCQVQSTMRLMGKEFTVGERNMQQLEDRKVWTDKQIIVETLCGSNDNEKTQYLSGMTENSTTRLLGGTGASSTYIANKESGPKQSLSIRNCEADLVEQHGFVSARRNPSPQYRSSFYQASPYPHQKHGFVIQESARCESYLSSSSPLSTHDVLGRITSSNSFRRRENRPRSTSALGFPVLHSKPTRSLCTSPSIYPSWSTDIEKRALMDHLPSFPDSLRSYYSDAGTSANLSNGPSLDKLTFNCLSSPYCFQKTDYNLSLLEDNWDTVKPTQKHYPSSEVDTDCGEREDESCSFNYLEKAKESDEFDSNESIDVSSELISHVTNNLARTAPVKLVAGGKHMLKSSTKAGQPNNLSPTSSTIRFVENMRTQNVLQSDEKPARVYKF